MTPLRHWPMPRGFLLASLLALAGLGCTFGVSEKTRDLTATGPESGWTVLTFKATAIGSTLRVTGTDAGVPTANATVAILTAGPGTSGPSGQALESASLSFGEPTPEGAETALPLTLSVSSSVEELPRVVDLTLSVPRARGVSVDVSDTPVSVSGLDGPLSVSTSNAGVTGDVGGGSVTTSNGRVDLGWTAASGLEVRTTNAEVLVGVPADAGVSFELSTTNGAVLLFGQRYAAPYTGLLNGGGQRLRVTTSNGDIVIR